MAAGLLRPDYPCSLKTLAEDFLGLQMDKTSTLSDWSRRPLKPAAHAFQGFQSRHRGRRIGAATDRLAAKARPPPRVCFARALSTLTL